MTKSREVPNTLQRKKHKNWWPYNRRRKNNFKNSNWGKKQLIVGSHRRVVARIKSNVSNIQTESFGLLSILTKQNVQTHFINQIKLVVNIKVTYHYDF